MSQFRNIVFKGGGVKGIAYIGAISVLESLGIIDGIRRVCGTSSGAIMAAHIALGGKAEQLGFLMSSRFLSSLLDSSKWPVRDFRRLIQDYGWFHGKRLSMWLKRHTETLSGKTDLTFGELARLSMDRPRNFKKLSVVTTNVDLQCPQVFSASTTPGVCIHEAVRASISIPFLFSAPRFHTGDIFVDGGLTWNYPLDLYDDIEFLSDFRDGNLFSMIDHPSNMNVKRFYNKETLGLMVETRREDADMSKSSDGKQSKIESFPNYLKAMLGLMTDVTAGNFLSLPDWQRTIFIEAFGVRATDFHISESRIKMLIDSGKQSSLAYFDWFTNLDNQPMNRVVGHE